MVVSFHGGSPFQGFVTPILLRIRENRRLNFQLRPGHRPEHIREYQAYLFRERKLDANTVNQRTGALRFFFVATLKKGWSIAETPYPRKVFRLPKILSPEQVARLIDAAPTPFCRTLLMALYATGLRRAELAHLKVSDIDSERMVIHVKGGKGRKDRDVMLSPKLLDELRQYWRGLRRSPKVWLFPGNRWHTGERPIDTKVVWHACRQAAQRAGLGDDIHSYLSVFINDSQAALSQGLPLRDMLTPIPLSLSNSV